mmetsp:Transcript_14230/g.43153  ORF Transcript_14230/g.43153 Transcript_14230/m.43153 type:complete len:436 (-) Transcript_14230:433-1740(-)
MGPSSPRVSALCLAAEGGHVAAVEALLQARASPSEARCSPGDMRRPLHLASARASVDVVRALLAAGAAADGGAICAHGVPFSADTPALSPLHVLVEAAALSGREANRGAARWQGLTADAVCATAQALLEAGHSPCLLAAWPAGGARRRVSPLLLLAQATADSETADEQRDALWTRLAGVLCRYGARTHMAPGSEGGGGGGEAGASARPSPGARIEFAKNLSRVQRAAAVAEAAYAEAEHVPRIDVPAQLPHPLRLLCAHPANHWELDALAPACTHCAQPFTEGHRRHHCRLTGRVVCAACSSKRASLGWVDSGRPCRVSDAAYNALITAESISHGSRADLPPAKDQSSAGDARAHLGLGTQTATQRRRSCAAGSAGEGPDDAAGAAGEALEALHQRGQQLTHLGERVDAMQREAESFYDRARQVRKQAERNSRWF